MIVSGHILPKSVWYICPCGVLKRTIRPAWYHNTIGTMIVGTSYTGGAVPQCVIISASLLDLLLSRHSGEPLHRETHDLRHGLHRSHRIIHVK